MFWAFLAAAEAWERVWSRYALYSTIRFLFVLIYLILIVDQQKLCIQIKIKIKKTYEVV